MGPDEDLTELKETIQETRDMVAQNNRILKSMQRASVVWTIVKILVWLIILGVPLYFFGPYIDRVLAVFSGTATSTPQSIGVFGLPSKALLQEAVDQYRVQ